LFPRQRYSSDDDFEKLLLQKRIPTKVIILKSFNQNTKQIVTTLLAKKDIIDSFINNEELMILEIY
jgi:predicted nuclease of predicted toxin-antitoxin system